MKADEIRERWNASTVESQATRIQVEIAAQLAELNQNIVKFMQSELGKSDFEKAFGRKG